MRFKQWLEMSRQKGRPLPEADPQYQGRNVSIYRGVLATEITFKPMDYVTLSYKFAKEHAEHTAAVEEEDAHVLRTRVPANQVFEAYNPGEYFYDGPAIPGESVWQLRS